MGSIVETKVREAVLVEKAHQINVLGIPVQEALPSRRARYEQTDPFILVHEFRGHFPPQVANLAPHPHRGFDNLWYQVKGSVATGHSTGPGGAMERVTIEEGGLLFIRTGKGVTHAEAPSQSDQEAHNVLFWVNLARKDKQVEPIGRVLQPDEILVRREGEATVRLLVGEGSPVELGTPALILDVALDEGGSFSTPVPPEFQGFVYVLYGEASFGPNQQRAGVQDLVLLGPGEALSVHDAAPGTRFLLMAGEPYREVPRFNGPYVD